MVLTFVKKSEGWRKKSLCKRDPGKGGGYPGAGASLADAYESLGLGRFGQSGTLFISSLLTSVVRSLSVRRVGYSGLMLPVAEDAGLAQRANESSFSIHDVLTYSAVCGMGVDTIPVPGDLPIDPTNLHAPVGVGHIRERVDGMRDAL